MVTESERAHSYTEVIEVGRDGGDGLVGVGGELDLEDVDGLDDGDGEPDEEEEDEGGEEDGAGGEGDA